MEKKIILSAQGLTKSYGPITVLDHVSVDFREGEIHALIGENGAGKSTLCKILSGAITPESGSIVTGGQTYPSLTPIKAKAAGIGMVYQEFNLVPELSIWENLFVGKEIRRGPLIDSKAMLQRSRAVFADMGVNIDCQAKIKDISVAYCQLVEIAKALLEESKLLILDEPTAPLTNAEIDILFRVLAKLKADGISMIYISHRLEEVFRMCDKITVLRDGQFIRTMDVADTSKEELIHLMIGRELSQEFPPRPGRFDYAGANTVLKVEHLTNRKLKDVSFELKEGRSWVLQAWWAQAAPRPCAPFSARTSWTRGPSPSAAGRSPSKTPLRPSKTASASFQRTANGRASCSSCPSASICPLWSSKGCAAA